MSDDLEYIIYDGSCYTIEWYFDDASHSQALDYYQSLNTDERIKAMKLFKRMGDAGEIKDKTKFMYEGDKIYAFKPQPDRFLCFFFTEQKIVVTNAFRKKQTKLPTNEKERALKIRNNYMKRVKAGDYYDK